MSRQAGGCRALGQKQAGRAGRRPTAGVTRHAAMLACLPPQPDLSRLCLLPLPHPHNRLLTPPARRVRLSPPARRCGPSRLGVTYGRGQGGGAQAVNIWNTSQWDRAAVHRQSVNHLVPREGGGSRSHTQQRCFGQERCAAWTHTPSSSSPAGCFDASAVHASVCVQCEANAPHLAVVYR